LEGDSPIGAEAITEGAGDSVSGESADSSEHHHPISEGVVAAAHVASPFEEPVAVAAPIQAPEAPGAIAVEAQPIELSAPAVVIEPVVDAIPVPAPVPEPAPAPLPVPAPAAAGYVLPVTDLQSIAATAGLEWVVSKPDKIAAAQEAIRQVAATPRPVRERRPVVVANDGPLIMVETHKDLSKLRLPFETAEQPPAAVAPTPAAPPASAPTPPDAA
jgi:ribonuclease E